MEHGLACRGKHEADVEALKDMFQQALGTQQSQKSNKYFLPIFFATFALIFLVYGLINPGKASALLFIMGAAFLSFSVALAFAIQKAYRRTK